MAWIHFSQQEAFDYIPLKLGLGYLKETDFLDKRDLYYYSEHAGCRVRLCSKLFTTRLRPLKPHLTYTVVKGDRYHAKPVEPAIKFTVEKSPLMILNLKTGMIKYEGNFVKGEVHHNSLGLNERTFPELDLGFKYATWDDLVEELLHLNKKAALDTPFYVNRLIPAPSSPARDPALH